MASVSVAPVSGRGAPTAIGMRMAFVRAKPRRPLKGPECPGARRDAPAAAGLRMDSVRTAQVAGRDRPSSLDGNALALGRGLASSLDDGAPSSGRVQLSSADGDAPAQGRSLPSTADGIGPRPPSSGDGDALDPRPGRPADVGPCPGVLPRLLRSRIWPRPTVLHRRRRVGFDVCMYVFIKARTGMYPVNGAVNRIKRRTHTL